MDKQQFREAKFTEIDLSDAELSETELSDQETPGRSGSGVELSDQDAAAAKLPEEDLVDLDYTEEDFPAEDYEEDAFGKRKQQEPKTIILQVNEKEEADGLDLFGVMGHMGRRWKVFRYVFLTAVCAGILAAAVWTGIRAVAGETGYASAVVAFSFDGIDEGLDPGGGLFDVNKIKSTPVINGALEELGWTDQDVEQIRANLKLEGVIPDSVKQQIAVINTVAEDAAEYYTNIEDLNYFPSRYTVTLKRCRGMSGRETRELLDAVLLNYKTYFMDSYADMSVLGTAAAVLDVESYDYLQAADMLENGIETMQAYVEAKRQQAPDFRANSTGLSFSDLSGSVQALKRLDLNNFISFVQSNHLTKDAGVQIDYYNYQIRQYNLEIQELQSRLADVEKTIQSYEKDPVIVMSNQDSVTQTSQKNEYYDELLARKLEINTQISALNTELNRAYEIANSLNGNAQAALEEDYAYADLLLKELMESMDSWTGLVQKTAEEYYETQLYANAYRIAIPAQYTAVGGIGEILQVTAVCAGACALLVLLAWGALGIREELIRVRRNETYTDDFSEMD